MFDLQRAFMLQPKPYPQARAHMTQPRLARLLLLAGAAVPAWAQSPDGQRLEPVVVSATRHPMALVDAPAAISVVTREQIEARGAEGVLDALRGETGISLQGRTISGRKTISLRGMDSRHTLILVDGKRIAASDGVVGHSDFQGDWIPAEDIERIEVVRGPMSVLYGSEALGGLVNVITRPAGETWALTALAEGTAAAGGRGGDGHRVALRAAGPLGKAWRLAATASDVRRQRVDAAADAGISELEGRHRRDAALQLALLPAVGQRVALEHRSGREERQAGARETRGARRYHQSVTAIDRQHNAFGWTADWGGALDARSLLRAYGSTMDVNNTRSNGVASLRPNRLQDRVLEAQVSLLPGRGQALTGGFELRDETLFNDGLPGGRGNARHRALYLQDEIELGRPLALTLGLRRDHHGQFGTEWSPRAYAVWRPAPQWTVKGGFGHGFKAPTLKQITAGYREDEGPNTFFGNPGLKPEANDAVEIGVGWESQRAAAQLMLFHNRVDNLIVARLFNTVGVSGQYVFENIDRARLQGAEAAFTFMPGGGLQAALNYQYLDATDGTGRRLEKRPRHTLGARLEWEGGAWRAGLGVQSTQGQLLASPVPSQPSQAVPAVTLAGAHAQWRATPAIELGAGVDNLGDVRLAEKSPLFMYAETPRTWRVSLRGRW